MEGCVEPQHSRAGIAMLWDSWLNVWRGRSLPKRRRVASGSSLKRAADVAGAWSKQPIESLEDRVLLTGAGALDPTFGSNGMEIVAGFYSPDNGEDASVMIAQDGKIVVAATTGAGHFGVARYNADGSPDESFGLNGKQFADVPALGKVTCATIDGHGKILVAGDTNANGHDFVVVRFNADGSLDGSFGVGGVLVTDFGRWDTATSIAIDRNGQIVVSGWSLDRSLPNGDPSSYKIAAARYNADGTLDSSFGNQGKLLSDINGLARSMVIDGANRIIIAGGTWGAGTAAVLVRLNSDGTVSSRFNTVTSALAQTSLQSIAIDRFGKIIVVGQTAGSGLVAARFSENGTLDTSFGAGGKLVEVRFNNTFWSDIAIDQQGKLVVFGGNGFSSFYSSRTTMVSRYNSDGTPDSSFGQGGMATVSLGTYTNIANSVVIDADNRILVAGGAGDSLVIARVLGSAVQSYSVFANDARKPEGINTPFTFIVKREDSSDGPASVSFSVVGTGTSPADANDFGGSLPSGTVNFADGEIEKTIAINVSSDTTVEGDESFFVTLSNPTSGFILSKSSATGTILQETLSISTANATKLEGSSGNTAFTFTVTRANSSSGQASVDFAAVGSGSHPADADDFGSSLPSGTLTFAAGESSKVITINVSGDSAVESDDGFSVSLSNASAGVAVNTESATGKILGDDFIDLIYVANSSASVVVGGGGSDQP